MCVCVHGKGIKRKLIGNKWVWSLYGGADGENWQVTIIGMVSVFANQPNGAKRMGEKKSRQYTMSKVSLVSKIKMLCHFLLFSHSIESFVRARRSLSLSLARSFPRHHCRFGNASHRTSETCRSQCTLVDSCYMYWEKMTFTKCAITLYENYDLFIDRWTSCVFALHFFFFFCFLDIFFYVVVVVVVCSWQRRIITG